MHPTPDTDVVVLMATALAAKRRPAELVEIVAAADLIQGFVPFADKLGEAIRRLSAGGLIAGAGDEFTLTPAAQEILADRRRNADTEERIAAVKVNLAAYRSAAECPPILFTVEQLAPPSWRTRRRERLPARTC